MIVEEQINARIAELQKERDEFLAQFENLVANGHQRIGAYNGAIGELKRLLGIGKAVSDKAEDKAS